MTFIRRMTITLGCLAALVAVSAAAELPADRSERDEALLARLDTPLLFVKRHNYRGIHIYDTFYKWGPGGGIYVIENPLAPPAERGVRPLIDPTTPESPGPGIYSDPDISWDATRVLFCHKPTAGGSTSIYEIGIDGNRLRRLTDPTPCCGKYKGSHGGVHDVAPAYLPDGRIVFTSTRPSGLVPCANEGVDILHVMNADGTDIHPISVNNVNEFDPCVLPDGRILHGRWEYVDKTALTQQSLWTIFPDGTNETALFANNMVHPEAILDARPIPGHKHLVVGSFTPHNSPPRGSIAFVDTRLGKDGPQAIVNLEHPDNPAHDRGESCDPWPLSKDVVLYSGRAPGHRFNAIMMIDRSGHRVVVHSEANIDCHSPMPVKPRPRPIVLVPATNPGQRTGRFFVQDIYQGLTGVRRGEVKWLRVIEETSRVSATPGGAYNQTFLMSAALGWSAKNFLGIVPVDPDGSAYFEVPSGRAIYWQALDVEGRLIQSMRTFVQAAPGVTRSCIGCHEHKYTASQTKAPPTAFTRAPDRLRPESWGSGFVDYPSMVQPIFDKHCVSCHGGEKGFAAGLDLSGGWTQHFSISYENLVSRRETQLTASLIAGIDCMNGTSLWSAQIFPPRAHGSGAAPLAEILVEGHKDPIPELNRPQRDLIMAWIDTNGLFHGTWDYSSHGCSVRAWGGTRNALVAKMRTAGCMECHHGFENDWFNLQRPELSRILRAPLATGGDGRGLALCRSRKLHPQRQRVRLLLNGQYHHGVVPPDRFKVPEVPRPEQEGETVVSFASTEDPNYQAMLQIIRDGRRQALATPRVDMPGAEIIPGACRHFAPPPIPEALPPLEASVDAEGVVRLAWERSAKTIGLSAELHRGPSADFAPKGDTLLVTTTLFQHADGEASPGTQHYALILLSGQQRSVPIRATLNVPKPAPPPAPTDLKAAPGVGRVELRWKEGAATARYHVYRAEAAAGQFKRLTTEPIAASHFLDTATAEGVKLAYVVRAVDRRGTESPATLAVVAAALPETKEPVFVAAFAENADAALLGGGTARAALHGKARIADAALDLSQGGHATFDHRPEFDLAQKITVECRVCFEQPGEIPVMVSCGHFQKAGWFLQKLGPVWRWHVGGIDCDGGKPAPGRWFHLVATYDGQTARLFEDGRLVAEKPGNANRAPWLGPLVVGQYSTPDKQFQVTGQIAGVKIYNRALPATDAAEAFKGGK